MTPFLFMADTNDDLMRRVLSAFQFLACGVFCFLRSLGVCHLVMEASDFSRATTVHHVFCSFSRRTCCFAIVTASKGAWLAFVLFYFFLLLHRLPGTTPCTIFIFSIIQRDRKKETSARDRREGGDGKRGQHHEWTNRYAREEDVNGKRDGKERQGKAW